MDLDATRRAYAEHLRALARLRSEALVGAFSKVPREHFLGPGPWKILVAPALGPYQTTPDADPIHLYRNVLIAIDSTRLLNNGQPSSIAGWFDALDLCPGDDVLHVGCGVGYYTAVLAETVGPTGRVTGVELDAELAARARTNLAYLSQVTVVHGDGSAYQPAPSDAIFINAGVTQPCVGWLDALRPGGRMILPLTASLDADETNALGAGLMLKITRHGDQFAAGFISPVGIFPCIGGRDSASEQRLRDAFGRQSWESVRSLRRDSHAPTDTCWLHGPEVCISR